MSTSKDLNYRLYLQKESGFTRTAYRTEFEKYAAIQSGDINKVQQNYLEIRKNYLSGKGKLSDDPVTNVRYHVIIATAITARMCVEGGLSHDAAYTLSDIYIQKLDKCQNTEGLLDLLGEMQQDFAKKMRELKKEDATSLHIRRCIDYIYEHLNEKLTLTELADVVKLNSSYLSMLFIRETGTSIKNFVLKAKVKTAENMLQYSELSSLEISMALGFSSQSAFISTFHRINGTTPQQYRNQFFQTGRIAHQAEEL